MLRVKWMVLSYALIGLFSADLRIRSATTRAPSMSVSGRTTQNSSPPKRPLYRSRGHFLDDIGDLLEDLVAGQMPVLIIDAFEMIGIDH